ncbi:hypothetical protein GCM10007190_06910 [Macrococcus hajekii]|uniref:hypothetical protein n=1 Tax=Macrococcus hajekii TaxID=198482 RepID=UPI00140CE6E6|nr:hypothetical protein [Macrococcus hajekii]GGB01450.1 hypothetical protein GCM10007190_06910 [Macrococcus hajekii]
MVVTKAQIEASYGTPTEKSTVGSVTFIYNDNPNNGYQVVILFVNSQVALIEQAAEP